MVERANKEVFTHSIPTIIDKMSKNNLDLMKEVLHASEGLEFCYLCNKVNTFGHQSSWRHERKFERVQNEINEYQDLKSQQRKFERVQNEIDEYQDLKRMQSLAKSLISFSGQYITHLPWKRHIKSIWCDWLLDSNVLFCGDKCHESKELIYKYVFRERLALLELAVIKFAIGRDVTFENIEEARAYSILDGVHVVIPT